MRVSVLVRPKPGILDPQGEAVRGGLDHLGFPVREARVGRVIDLDIQAATAEEARAAAEEMCRQLLANPLIESYEIEITGNGHA
jgi:phosphoribosylformylglycinamidine synthase subunit PurS